jgi:hypothetical protein
MNKRKNGNGWVEVKMKIITVKDTIYL